MANILPTDKKIAVITDDPKQPKRSVTVLKIPPSVSPETAVRVAIMQELRDAETAEA